MAVHRAMVLLRSGQCGLAVVGGVNTLLSPEAHESFTQAGMLSADGRCKAFSAQANGYVRGEGVGMLVLKPLSAAQRDGDHIYGLILGSAQNHGGRANSLTAPNPVAQAQLVESAFREAGVDPRTVGYIEAHGTGTSLGDPVEVQGLKRAFRALAGGQELAAGSIGLGTIKSNIGHLELAAGVAGLIKVLLQMGHKRLVKSLHAEPLNPRIDLEGSPFYVVNEERVWEAPVDETGRALPRRAGVSSFGFGGVNAHVVLEEYEESASDAPQAQAPTVVVLSARTGEQLRAQAAQLRAHLERREVNLASLAYTLQVGREVLGMRLALVVSSVSELTRKLLAYEQGETSLEDVYQGEVKRGSETLSAFAADEDLREVIAKWLARGKLGKLAELWVQGLAVDWSALYGASGPLRPSRVSLPTYPFAKERYWVPESGSGTQAAQAAGSLAGSAREAVLHPLVHRNTSDLSEQRYSTWLTGEEFVLRDHIVLGQRVVPGVAQLEWARAAVSLALGGAATIRLEQVSWVRRLAVAEPLAVHIGLEVEDDGRIGYEIYSGEGEAVQVYSQGWAVVSAPGEAPTVDLAALRAQCGRTFSSEDCYARFAAMGLHQGPSFQSLTQLQVGPGLAVGSLQWPAPAPADDDPAYGLPPSLLDGALQTSLGLMPEEAGPTVPFAVQSVEQWLPVPVPAYAVVRPAAGDSEAVRKLQVEIVDPQGRVAVRLSGFSSRAVERPVAAQTVLLTPQWAARPLAVPAQASAYAQHWVLWCEEVLGVEGTAQLEAQLQAELAPAQCVRLSGAGTLAQRYGAYAGQVLAQLKRIVSAGLAGSTLVQLVVPGQGDGAVLQGLGGMLRSAAREYPLLTTQVVLADAGPGLAARLHAEAAQPAAVVRHGATGRDVLEWVERPPSDGSLPWRDGGVYWITGGLGGLGRVFAQAIAQQVREPVLVLSGRRALEPSQAAWLQELRARGARVEYRSVAVDDGAAMAALSRAIVAEHGQLNGVIHTAGVLRDSLLANKTDVDLGTVLQPKVAGVVALDEATRELALEWLVLCSSVASVWGNVGQVDYAAGNGFLDAYAAYRQGLVSQGLRRGRTVSLSWPWWAAGGMQVDAAGQERMRRSTGMEPLPDEAGIAALVQSMSVASDASHVLVLHGDRARLLASVRAAYEAKAVPVQADTVPVQAESVQEWRAEAETTSSGEAFAGQLERALTGLMAGHLKMARERLERDAPLSEFGFDSISLTSFGNVLNQRYGLTLSPTVFFEAPTIAALTAHLVREHGDVLAPAFAVAPTRQQGASQDGQTARSVERVASVGRRRGRRPLPVSGMPAEPASVRPEPIAVIGMSGCFPEAPDIETLWANLQAGRDCIGELPASRWSGRPAPTVRRAGVIQGVEEFDPLFFGISPREAQGMDPQQRLLMTYVYRALEDAGYSVQSLSGSSTALLVGTGTSGYGQMLTLAGEEVTGSSAAGVVGSMGPNRMSYWLNWHGPSEPVETACSSSLVAVHRAMVLLRSGQCGLAVVGGVNTLLSPEAHESFTQAGMLSADGRCKAFSAQANGYVRGEGVGMLVLKPLSAAQRDGDHIYGLILGSAQNHGGRANSLTAPNPVAQAQLVESAFREAGVDPRTVGYIEAHGTGTSLGDPVEVQGLKRAFRALADGQALAAGSIGLGTIKSNIGHLELAAGVAGLIKVLLQMRHKRLVKSLHAEPLNPRIDLDDSPFYVVNEERVWKAPVDETGRALPRRAGVSSFGFGGVNAHVVLEEYEESASDAPQVQAPTVVVLSARTGEQLRAQAAQLRAHLERREVDLASLAYTLQVGREALGMRLALVVNSVAELTRKLLAYEQGETSLEDVYQGEVKRGSETLSAFAADEDLREVIAKWLARGKVGKLAELWVQGLAVDWSALYGPSRPSRVSLPTYPFAKERYWVPENGSGTQAAQLAGALAGSAREAVLHPLVHRNTSTLREQRYSTWLTGEEHFLRDHVVRGQKLVPGVAQLEWARAAASLALEEEGAIRIEQVSWMRPLAVAEPLAVHIGLEIEDDGRIGYEIYSGEGEAVQVYSQGWAVVSAPDEAPTVDLAALRAQCGRTINRADCYARFASKGLAYGPSFQVLNALQVGDSVAIGSLQGHASQGSYGLPPSLLDGALQASLGLTVTDDGLALPFAVQSVEQWLPVPVPAYAVVRPAAGDSAAVRKLQVEIVDPQGRVAVRLSQLSSRALPVSSSEGRTAESSAPAAMGHVAFSAALPEVSSLFSPSLEGELLLAPLWEAVSEAESNAPPSMQQVIQLQTGTQTPFTGPPAVAWSVRDSRETLVEALRREGPLHHIVWQVPAGEAGAAVMALRLVQALLALEYGTRSLGLTIVTRQAVGVGPDEAADPDQAGVHGLVGSLAKEYPQWRVSLLDLPKNEDLPLAALLAQPAEARGDARAWRAGRWHQQGLAPCAVPKAAVPPYREGGLYVVLGGAGGIGMALSEHLIRRYRAQLVWLGRRAEDEAIGEHRARLGRLGPTPLYLQADATDQDALELAHATIRERFGAIHGVVHAAIVLADRSLATMDEVTFQAALTAKAATAENLDAVFGDESLDFLVFFSSLQSFMKAPGQSNYAAGCCYADAFAKRLRHRPYSVKLMHWGYWGSVGVVASDDYRQRMARAGIGSIEPPEAMEALDRL
ncbi:SDR family NAD(P)-dependent oxidoreductase [Achromobacter deleyi]|uniref:SDR family NAD(P)-dependent oxidoreductase n=1 Tax=Achromobacter deleyi TaxID=1353891 RepID=UPI00286BA0F0|nr:SDR family NAD(P)-dependent oxidoreductase [Achromobacter deleyi]